MTPRARRALLGGLLAAVATAGLYALLAPLADRATLPLPVGDPPWELRAPQGLLALLLVPLVWWTTSWSLTDMVPGQRALGGLARSLLIACLALSLAEPAAQQESQRVSVVFLVDVSDSVRDAALERAAARVQAAWEGRGEDDVQLVTFARQARAVPLPAEGPLRIERHVDGTDGSDPQAALRLALGLFPAGHLRRAVLISDGLQTQGDLLAEASRARDHGVRLFAEPVTDGPPPEVGIKDLTLPPKLRAGEPFPIQVTLFATAPSKVQLKLFQGALLNGLDGVRELTLPVGETRVELRSVARVPGTVTYRASLTSHGPDRFAANNQFARSVTIPGQPQVLYIEGERGGDRHLSQALGAAGFDLDVRSPEAAPQRAAELSRFDFVILSDVPADRLSLSATEALERFIRDGGGFLMAGGPNSFGLGGYRGSRMERILPVRLDSERRRDRPSLALALVIDKSGSMSGQKMELAKEAARATAELLGPDDYIGVIGFDARPTRVVRAQSARNRLSVLRGIGRLSAGGGTAIFPALDAAYQDLAATRAKLKHVILLTDGRTQESGIPLLVQNMRADGITVSTIGLGQDVHRSLLQQAAQLGGGRAYFTSEPHNIPRLFMRETHTVARSAAVEDYVRAHVERPADFLRGIPMGSAPVLRGYVATLPRPAPAQVILRSDLGEPLLARWRLGLGWSLAWTSDVKARWSVEWLRWRHFSQFWAQLVREHMRRSRQRHFALRARVQDDVAHITLDAIDQQDRFLNDLDGELTLRRSGAGDQPSALPPLPLVQTAPGRYEAEVPLPGYGSFALRAALTRDGRRVAVGTGSVSHPFPFEYADFKPDPAFLELAAAQTGTPAGATDPFDPADAHVRAYVARWPWPLWPALGLFLIDVALRRLRWRGR